MSHFEVIQKPESETPYHIYNRGVEKRDIFNSDHDRERFLDSLILFNTTYPSDNTERHRSKSNFEQLGRVKKPPEPLVQILAYCLMPNHYHLILRGVEENGITEFMRKIGTGYTNYFNKKNERVGPLFQGKFKAKPIEDDGYLQYLIHYIHFNPLDINQSMDFLNNYPWSSYQECLNCSKFDFEQKTDIVDWPALAELGINKEGCRHDSLEWLISGNRELINDLTIE